MSRRGLAAFLLGGLLLVGGCKGSQQSAVPKGAGAAPTVATEPLPPAAPRAANAEVWQDPEPADAQARAEQVVGAPWNRDKTTTVKATTTTLTMAMTTLVDRRTGIAGFTSGVAKSEVGLDERLARLGAEQTATEVTIRLPGSVLFDFDSAAIRPDAERSLGEVVAVLQAYARRPIRVEGHTDAIASDDYNLKLSQHRAESVKAWLVAHGIESSRMKATGLGKTKPVADNATPEGRQKNRRVEIVIEKG